ncbi:MAG: hypothetical protein IJ106_03275 [Parasporobacterium sp.]|nr:hypothetical protein [Parasporobacterium sp.]
MKKIICLMIAVVMAAGVLTACGSGNSGNTAATTADQQTTAAANADAAKADETGALAADAQTEAPAADRYTFVYKGTNIALKAEAAAICEALGDAKSYTEETSCAFDGLDKNYTYTSFIMTTYPDGDRDRVNSITLLDDTVSTFDGISIGDSKDKVEEVYGADSFNGVNAYIMTDGDAQLTVIIDGDKVSSIQYTAVFE